MNRKVVDTDRPSGARLLPHRPAEAHIGPGDSDQPPVRGTPPSPAGPANGGGSEGDRLENRAPSAWRSPGVQTPTAGHNTCGTHPPTGPSIGRPDGTACCANLARSGRSTNRKLTSARTTNMAIQAISPTSVCPNTLIIATRARTFQR